jgi:type II secretory pathway component PulF
MIERFAILLVPPGMMMVGLAILWAQSRGSLSGPTRHPERLGAVISAAGWVLLLLGLFATVGLMTHAFFLVAWVVTAVVLLSLMYRFQGAERRSLLWMLMLAAQRRIPLETAARAFAQDRHDQIGARALDLAAYLEAGLPLALALKRSRLSFPHAVLLAAELGQQTDNLGNALQQALGSTDDSEVILRSAMERAFYLAFLALFSLAMVAFLMLKIIPAFQKILYDFEFQMPPATMLLVEVARAFTDFWPVLLPLVAILAFALVGWLSYYTGFSSRYLPGLSPTWHRADRSVIMLWLALAVRQNRPIPDMMRLIAGYLTRHRLRRKVEAAARRIDQGADWIECLRQVRLIRTAEVAVFRSAERTGNLAWALEEMSQSSSRRSIYRLRAFINLAFPAAIIAMGGSVLLVMFGILTPLIKMISGLT